MKASRSTPGSRSGSSSASGRAARLANAGRATPCHFSRRYDARRAELIGAFHAAFEGE